MTATGTSAAPALPSGAVLTWLRDVTGAGPAGPGLVRAIARREAWRVDADAFPPGWLRVTHPGDPANSAASLARETALVRALGAAGVPVPRVLAELGDAEAVLFERVPGRSDLERCPPDEQRRVYEHLLEIMAGLHARDIGPFRDVGLELPEDAYACATGEVERLAAAVGDVVEELPLLAFAVGWVRRNAPEEVPRTSLVHGDAGAGNFLFADGRVTSVVDWEWAHLGDPLEDLGNMLVRASFAPSGDWPALLRHYERVSGIPLDLRAVRYHRAANLVRSALALVPVTRRLHPRDPVALNECYRIVCNRLLCEAVADAAGVALERPELPPPDAVGGPTSVLDVVAANLDEVLPEVGSAFARDRVDMAARLVRTQERRRRYADWLVADELTGLRALAGRPVRDVVSGRALLREIVAADGGARDAEIIRHLARRAWLEEAVAAPITSLFPGLVLRPVA